jgi:hypothetical protein
MIAVLYDQGGAEIDRLPIPAPHSSPQNLDFINVAPKTYQVKIHETPDGVTLANLRHDFWVDASLSKLFAYTVKTFQVDLGRGAPYYDPAAGTSDYINPDLDQLDYTVFKPGYGPLDWAADITPYTGGGFSFTNGQVFAQDEIYTILVNNLLQQPVTQSGASFPEDIVEITASVVFSSAHYNMLLEIIAPAAFLTITMPPFNTIPDGTKFIINTERHNDVLTNCILQLPTGKQCFVGNNQYNTVYMGRNEEAAFIKKGDYLKLLHWHGDRNRIGEIILKDGNPPANSLALTGFWILQTDIPRGFNWYINTLPPSELASGTDNVTPTGNDIRKWVIGATMVWVPDHRNMHYRVSDGTRLANSFQDGELGPGTIKTTAWTGNGIGKNSLTSDSIGFLATQGDGGSISSDSQSGTNRNTARTLTFSTITPNGEHRVKNVAKIAYVII